MMKPDPAFAFPPARRDPESGLMAHGRWYADPYAWMEAIDDPEAEAWVSAQEAVTRSVLDALPGRDWLRAAVSRSARHARLSRPIRRGPHGREFLWQADPNDEKLRLLMRRRAGEPLEPVIDPNAWPAEETRIYP
jgi:prolyl oligopeptidase